MNKIMIFPVLFVWMSCSNNSNRPARTGTAILANVQVDETAEQAAIMQVIEDETECFFQRDYACWKSHFVQDAYAFQAWNNSDGSVDTKTGWNEIDRKIKAYLGAPENRPVNTMGQENGVNRKPSSHPKVIRKNILFKFFTPLLAYVMWDQYNSDPDELRYTFSKDCRIMEKINNEWKIVNVSSYWDYRRVVTAAELK